MERITNVQFQPSRTFVRHEMSSKRAQNRLFFRFRPGVDASIPSPTHFSIFCIIWNLSSGLNFSHPLFFYGTKWAQNGLKIASSPFFARGGEWQHTVPYLGIFPHLYHMKAIISVFDFSHRLRLCGTNDTKTRPKKRCIPVLSPGDDNIPSPTSSIPIFSDMWDPVSRNNFSRIPTFAWPKTSSKWPQESCIPVLSPGGMKKLCPLLRLFLTFSSINT